MQTKTKQRWVGFLILLAILAIFLPLVFHNARPTTEMYSSVKIPPQPKVNIAQKTVRKEQVELNLAPASAPAKTLVLTSKTKAVEPAVIEMAESVAKEKQLQHLQKDKARADLEQSSLVRFEQMPKAWCVQLGTFGNIDNANVLVGKLRKKGFDAYTRPVLDSNGKRLLRVYVGPEVQKESALQLRAKLETSLHLKGIVRQYRIKT